ncbi:hypothetical protein MKW94_022497, partial [Papaver nudicaule]|nr:hypothetical protein [Papaver nudicaule]
MESRREAISAAIDGDLNRLKELVVEYDDGRGLADTVMSFNNENGRGAIHYAAAKGKLNVLDYLIEDLGIDVNLKDERGDSPLLHATFQGNMNTVQYLLGKGADPNTSDCKGYTPLHSASAKGYTEILTLLLSRGADVNAFSDFGTPLEMAAGEGHLEAMQILLDHNANPNLFCSHLFTPLTTSILSGLPQSVRCVKLLLEAGADPNSGTHDFPSLIAAVAVAVASAVEGLTTILKLLIQAGANPDVTNF